MLDLDGRELGVILDALYTAKGDPDQIREYRRMGAKLSLVLYPEYKTRAQEQEEEANVRRMVAETLSRLNSPGASMANNLNEPK